LNLDAGNPKYSYQVSIFCWFTKIRRPSNGKIKDEISLLIYLVGNTIVFIWWYYLFFCGCFYGLGHVAPCSYVLVAISLALASQSAQ
jgi:hypothetical protein